MSPNQLLFTKVRDHILADLATLDVKSGQRYFTEAQLSSRYQVSRNTIRRAMGELEHRGYLQRQRGRGSIILQIPGQSGTPATPRSPRQQTLANRPSASTGHRRLITMLPQWDDTTEGFYAAHVIHAMTATEDLRRYALEIRHANDPLDFAEPTELTFLAIDPRGSTVHRLSALASAGSRIVVATPSHPMNFALNLHDDIRPAVNQAVRLMAEAQHRSVGIILHDLEHNDFRQAINGYLDACGELGLSIHPKGIVRCFTGKPEPGPDEFPLDDVRAWISTHASGVHRLADAARKHKLNASQDLSIIGMDDPNDHYIGVLGREISVIRSDPLAMARTVGNCINRWDDALRGQTIAIPMQYLDRQSVASPRHTSQTRMY
jgi:DNA-binding transcriptional regulator YhcF (GntR family)